MIVLHIGDVMGRPGRNALAALLPELVREHEAHLVVVNGENAAGGAGITSGTAQEILAAGADCITTGNHVWTQREAYTLLDKDHRVLRPANYPEGVPGVGAGVFPTQFGEDLEVGVLSLCGRVFMHELDCPFRRGDEEIQWLRERTPLIVVDFHAEATSEKTAFARYVDGRVSAVVGTHTHVQTADERILDGGTAFITDAGMTGATDSIIGVDPEPVLKRFVTQLPARFDPPKSGPARLCGVVLELDAASGHACRIERIRRDMPQQR
jgi:metallophosphoesterase (TIGR00282 family)